MRPLLILFAIALLSFKLPGDTATDMLGVKGPLQFNGVTFNLASATKPDAHFYIQEYLPDGQKFDSYEQMITINVLAKDITVKQAVQQKLKDLEKRKKSDPVCHYSVSNSPDNKEYIIDFLMGESQDDHMTLVEFNIYRYAQIELSNNKKAILLYAYTKRSYGENITSFLKGLKYGRETLINKMISDSLPSIRVQD